MAQATQDTQGVLQQMDDAEVGKVHWKIMFISGMGFLPNGITHRSMSGWSRQQDCRQRRPGAAFRSGCGHARKEVSMDTTAWCWRQTRLAKSRVG
jgi:hypothetical protein